MSDKEELIPEELPVAEEVKKSSPKPKKKAKQVTIECLSTQTREVKLKDGRVFYLTIGQTLTDSEDLILTERLRNQIDKGIFKVISEI